MMMMVGLAKANSFYGVGLIVRFGQAVFGLGRPIELYSTLTHALAQSMLICVVVVSSFVSLLS